jgi:hypothetical protein
MFFDKKCNISTISYTKVGWDSKRTKTTLYSNIECNFELAKKGIIELEKSKNSNYMKYTINVPVQYNLIRNNYDIELIDDVLWSMGSFIIADIQSFKSISWSIDCITFTATESQWQQ